jgi:hypothetical protein
MTYCFDLSVIQARTRQIGVVLGKAEISREVAVFLRPVQTFLIHIFFFVIQVNSSDENLRHLSRSF